MKTFLRGWIFIVAGLLFGGCGGGGSSSSEDAETVGNLPPVIEGAADRNVTLHEPITLTIDAYDRDGTVVSYRWSIDGNDVSTEASFLYTFEGGEHLIKVTVTDDDGAETSAEFKVFVPTYPRPALVETYDQTGTMTQKILYEYNADGNMTRKARDNDGDGRMDWIEALAYDTQGHLVSDKTDNNADGRFEYDYTYEYNDEGRLVAEYRKDVNGMTTYIKYYYYAQVLAEERTTCEPAAYPVTGTGIDSDGDGSIDRFTYYQYDEAHRLIQIRYDDDADSFTDRSTHYDYDTNGNLLMLTRRDRNGNPTYILHAVYDQSGRKILQTTDLDGDGSVDTRIGYTYDSSGNLTLVAYDDNNDGTADRRTLYTYDTKGRKLSIQHDSDADGNIDYAYYFTYNSRGQMTGVMQDHTPADGIMDWIAGFEYDATGLLTKKTVDSDGDGTIDATSVIRYEGEYPTPSAEDLTGLLIVI